DGRARRRPRHDVLQRPHVPAELSQRHLLGPAWFLEPDHAGGRACDVHPAQGRRHRRQDRSVRRRLAHRERRISWPARRRRTAPGRVAAGVRRFRRRHLSHLVRGPLTSSLRAALLAGAVRSCRRDLKSMPSHRRTVRRIAVAALLLATAAPSAAGDVAAGRRKAIACQACHGLDGLSKLPDAPHLAGQPERYLMKSLDEYRKGVRKNELMSIVVKDLSDQDIADLASYYGAIEISAQPPKYPEGRLRRATW